MAYCTATDVKGKSVNRPINDAGWADADIDLIIIEADNYINSKLLPMGFTTTQLGTAVIVKTLSILYSRYAVIRDIYVNASLSRSPGQEFTKWLEIVDKMLDQILKGEMQLYTSAGVVISPAGGDARMTVISNTETVKQIITLDEPENWSIDATNYADETIGEH